VIVAALALLTSQPQTILTVDPGHRLVEGVASDGKMIWVSSILDRTVLECRASCRTLARLPEGLHPFGIAWDRARKRLWVAADCPPKVAGIKECERGALIALDQRGRIRSRTAPTAGKFHPGDVSASPGGVMVSDSQNGAVYRLAGNALAAVVAPRVGKSGQGSAIGADGKRLVVADYSQGITSIDLGSGARTLLPRQDGKPLRGIDGLVRCGTTFFGIYNGQAPGTLVSFTVTDRGLTYDQPLGDTTLPDPTQIAFDGKRLLIVADSGWATLDKPDFVRKSGAPVIAIPLGKDCKPL
jgi:hypothetical protein